MRQRYNPNIMSKRPRPIPLIGGVVSGWAAGFVMTGLAGLVVAGIADANGERVPMWVWVLLFACLGFGVVLLCWDLIRSWRTGRITTVSSGRADAPPLFDTEDSVLDLERNRFRFFGSFLKGRRTRARMRRNRVEQERQREEGPPR